MAPVVSKLFVGMDDVTGLPPLEFGFSPRLSGGSDIPQPEYSESPRPHYHAEEPTPQQQAADDPTSYLELFRHVSASRRCTRPGHTLMLCPFSTQAPNTQPKGSTRAPTRPAICAADLPPLLPAASPRLVPRADKSYARQVAVARPLAEIPSRAPEPAGYTRSTAASLAKVVSRLHVARPCPRQPSWRVL